MIERLLPLAATIYARTLRLQWSGEALPKRAVIVFWHGKMFAGWFAARKFRPIALVSKSKDGRLLSAVLRMWKYRLVRGSSGKKGMEALTEAIDAIRAGAADSLVITPDGPRGPRHSFKRGAFIAARELDYPLFVLRITYHSSISLARSWDRFELPFPFSKVSIHVERVDAMEMPASDPDAQRAWLDTISHRFSD